MDAHALHRRGWTISAIARHLGHDRKTIRAYLHGEPGRRAAQRGPSRTRSSRSSATAANGWPRTRTCGRPRCSTSCSSWATTAPIRRSPASCGPAGCVRRASRAARPRDRPVAVIEHPPGEETQWDWLELPDPPQQWGWGSKAFLLVGALAHSGRWRGVLAESTDQPHLIDALHRVCAAAGRADPQPGGSTGWPPSATRAPARSPPRSPRSPSTTGCRWRSARRGAGTARAWWRRPTTPPRNAGGAPWPTTSPSEQAQARLDRWCAAARRHPAAPDRRRQGHRGHRRRRASRSAAAAGAVPGRPGRASGSPARRRWSPSAATTTRCRPSWPAPRSP